LKNIKLYFKRFLVIGILLVDKFTVPKYAILNLFLNLPISRQGLLLISKYSCFIEIQFLGFHAVARPNVINGRYRKKNQTFQFFIHHLPFRNEIKYSLKNNYCVYHGI